MTTPLGAHLRQMIAINGPITVARFMAEALGNPDHGYYMTRDPFGATGDFITAPEVSQMFGELFGAWCADLWRQMGMPSPVALIEVGPGRGTLMSDALRATRQIRGFHAALNIHLVETSPLLRARQASALAAYDVRWHDAVDDVPTGPAIVVANELFDALPIHQFQFADGQWHERLIEFAEDGAFRFVLDPTGARFPGLNRFADPPPNAIAEICPSGAALALQLAGRLAGHPGAALIVDYGHVQPGFGDTVQGVRAHRAQDIFDAPGTVDICAHVDFAALRDAAHDGGARVWGPVAQGAFLTQLGIETRAAALTAASPTDSASIAADMHRLTGPNEMGRLFKVLALTSAGLEPAGFDDT
ncbi:MAG: SAM-dependent methyltransferase [Proteobacteria bacterium]|nr:SAM-dependent methyltransferase [Pseudomonadota bacterium]MDA1058717.1 SAM-dependent methyltransferase [Pseudomonadota bacterium]